METKNVTDTSLYEICAKTNPWMAQRSSFFINRIKEYNNDNTIVTVVLLEDQYYTDAIEWLKDIALEMANFEYDIDELIKNGMLAPDFTSYEYDGITFFLRPQTECQSIG